jgi:hypothetical protein
MHLKVSCQPPYKVQRRRRSLREKRNKNIQNHLVKKSIALNVREASDHLASLDKKINNNNNSQLALRSALS